MDWFLYDIGLRHERVKKNKLLTPPLHCLPIQPRLQRNLKKRITINPQ